MVEVKHVRVYNLERSIMASGNPMTLGEIDTTNYDFEDSETTDKACNRARNLGSSSQGEGHDNFLSGILVVYDIKYPQYFSPEFQRYHFHQIISSQSKMHRLILAGNNHEFNSMFNTYVDTTIIDIVNDYIKKYNYFSHLSIEQIKVLSNIKDDTEASQHKKDQCYYYFMKALSNTPLGYEMWMTVSSNYLQLKTQYRQRKNHKLKEDWGSFCKMCEDLPRFLELTQGDKNL
jgi:hypothetical protein